MAADLLSRDELKSAMTAPRLVANPIDQYVDGMRTQVIQLLTNKRFDDLDKMAAARMSHDKAYWQGKTELSFFFNALVNPGQDGPKTDRYYLDRIALLSAWANARPQSVVAQIALAQIFHAYGWFARSSEWSSKVTTTGWRLLNERDDLAKQHLDAAKRLGVACPELELTELLIYRGVKGYDQTFEVMFERAVKKFPGYRPLYFEKAEALLPRWGGNEGESAAFIKTSADKFAGKEGDILYTQIAWRLHRYWHSEDPFKTMRLDYPRMSRGFYSICSSNPTLRLPRAAHCLTAAMAGDKKTAAGLFAGLSGQVDEAIWGSLDAFVKLRAAVLD